MIVSTQTQLLSAAIMRLFLGGGGGTLRDSAGTLAESLSRMSFAAKTL